MKQADAWLCYAYGETDKPCVSFATNHGEVEQFILREWLGSDGNDELPGIMAEFAAHDWTDGPLEWEFEIGGVTIEQVFATLIHDAKAAQDSARLDFLTEEQVDTIYFDNGRILDVGRSERPHDVRAAIDGMKTAKRRAVRRAQRVRTSAGLCR